MQVDDAEPATDAEDDAWIYAELLRMLRDRELPPPPPYTINDALRRLHVTFLDGDR